MSLVRNVLCIIVVLVFATVAFSEVVTTPGIVAGVNIANMTMKDGAGNDLDPAPDSKTGFIGGVVADFEFSRMVSVMPGVVFAMRGMKIEEMGITSTASLSYLTIPVLVKANFSTGAVKPFLAVGPDVGFLLTAKSELEGTMFGVSIDTSTDIKDETQSVDFGLDFGAGAEFDLEKLIPYIQAGYYLGLTNVVKDPVGDQSAKNKGFLIQAGVRFKL